MVSWPLRFLRSVAEERHWRLSSMSRISVVVAVSPSLGKMRSTLFAWAAASGSFYRVGGKDHVVLA